MQNNTGYVASIKRYMNNDGPGVRTVVFLKGCLLRCKWCSSPQTWNMQPNIIFIDKKCIGCGKCKNICSSDAIKNVGHRIDYRKCIKCGKCIDTCPAKAIKYDCVKMSVKDVFDEVVKDEHFYKCTGGGVTLSGGEATLQSDFACEILKLCKERRINTALESCGQTEYGQLAKVLKYTDFLYYDLKHMDSEIHKKLTGFGNEVILNNIEKANKEYNCDITINLPLIPECNNNEYNYELLLSFMKKLALTKIRILKFHKLGEHEYKELDMKYPLEKSEKLSLEDYKKCIDFFESNGVNVVNA